MDVRWTGAGGLGVGKESACIEFNHRVLWCVRAARADSWSAVMAMQSDASLADALSGLAAGAAAMAVTYISSHNQPVTANHFQTCVQVPSRAAAHTGTGRRHRHRPPPALPQVRAAAGARCSRCVAGPPGLGAPVPRLPRRHPDAGTLQLSVLFLECVGEEEAVGAVAGQARHGSRAVKKCNTLIDR